MTGPHHPDPIARGLAGAPMSRRGLLRVGVLTMLVMSLVELVQGAVVPGRAFDIDDVILNTTGALVGYLLLGRRLGRAVHPRRRHWWHRWTMRERPAAPRAEKT